MSGQAPALVGIRNLVKRFGLATAVDDISLDVGEGEFLTFLGSSGSGKTTTLFIVAGFEDPTSGDVLIDGRSVLSIPPNERNIGMVFQRYTLFPHMTVAENVAFPLSVRRRPRAEIDRTVKEMLAVVRLESFANRKPSQLSGGQQQRVALARALVYRPRILLMDEPLAALDKKLREEIQQEIRRIHRDLGVTILYVTHDQEEALRLSDRIAVFSHGKIVQIGTGIDLYERPADEFVAGFVGNSNFLAGRAEAVAGDRIAVRLEDGTLVHGRPGQPISRGASVKLMVRPERLRLMPAGEAADPSCDCRLEVVLRDATYLGESRQHEVLTRWQQSLLARGPGTDFGPAPGASLMLGFRSADALIFDDSGAR